MDIDGAEAGAGESGGHLDFAVYALLAQDRDGGAGGSGIRKRVGDNALHLERKEWLDAGVGAVLAELVFGIGTGGVVAEGGHPVRHIRPHGAEGEEVFIQEDFAAALDAEAVLAVERTDARGAGFEAVLAEGLRNGVEVGGADLDDGA